MSEFFQTYGIWIVFGALFLLMMRMHGGAHGGCGMGDHGSPLRKDESGKEDGLEDSATGVSKRSGSCH